MFNSFVNTWGKMVSPTSNCKAVLDLISVVLQSFKFNSQTLAGHFATKQRSLRQNANQVYNVLNDNFDQ